MRLKSNIIILVSCLMLLFSGCTKPEVNQTINPFEDIPMDEIKRIEFLNFTVTSGEKESGRGKMVTDKQDIQNIANYLKTISCTKSNQKDKNPDFSFSLTDNTDTAKGYIYSIGVSRNQIFIYKHKGDETTKFVYKYSDAKVVAELRKLYNSMNYKEDLLMKK